jgi:outer membrane receptor for Fe3+-dicitrate
LKQQVIGVRDCIVAEDNGKFAEANVAESLQRVPGVYLVRDSPRMRVTLDEIGQ